MTRDLINDLEIFEHSGDFWTAARNDVLLKLISGNPVFDVGAGSGILTKELVKRKFDVYALDVEKRACELCSRFTKNTICSSFDKLNTKNLPKFKSIVLADVIEHVENDIDFIKKAHDLLEENGELIISVPYAMFLWTKNDSERGHKRRYGISELKKKLEICGFRIEKIFLWNFLSVFPILLGKIFSSRIPHESLSESKFNSLLSFYFRNFENKILVPIGSNIICKAVKV